LSECSSGAEISETINMEILANIGLYKKMPKSNTIYKLKEFKKRK